MLVRIISTVLFFFFEFPVQIKHPILLSFFPPSNSLLFVFENELHCLGPNCWIFFVVFPAPLEEGSGRRRPVKSAVLRYF